MTLAVSPHILAALLREAGEAAPQECCGILLGDGNRVSSIAPARNVHPDPFSHFEIDPQALINAHRAARGGGVQVLGYYHSHPNGRPRPSATDAAMAAGDGSVWAIIAADRVTFWRAGDAGFTALPYEAHGR